MSAHAGAMHAPHPIDREAIATAVDIAHPAAPPDVRSDLIEAEIQRQRAQGGAA